MTIKMDQFCGLSTAPQWQSWLFNFNPVLYQELMTHLQSSKGCAHNREKMVELVGKIKAAPLGWSLLLEFIRSAFPSMLEADTQAALPQQPSVDHGVPFDSYNPKMLSFPRRFIVHGESPEDAAAQASVFVSDKPKYDFVVVGSRAYVEFVPAAHSTMADRIPAKNWLVTEFKRRVGS